MVTLILQSYFEYKSYQPGSKRISLHKKVVLSNSLITFRKLMFLYLQYNDLVSGSFCQAWERG